MLTTTERGAAPPRVAFYNNPKVRGVFYQLALLALALWLGYEFVLNAKSNLDAQRITSGFGFLDQTAGFSVNQSLIPYNESDTRHQPSAFARSGSARQAEERPAG